MSVSASGFAALVLTAALLTSGCLGPRIGVVDTRRVLNESVKALRYQKQLDEREKLMAADLALLTPRMRREEIEARRALYLRELQEMKRELETRLDRELREAVAQVAQQRRLQGVFVKGNTPLGGTDITGEVLEKLK
ncbi:MAG: OmpH family outer membrane protein [Armatimonadetes bacterium]|nr:OmpH family outer membrane protein [Armatimonadota bacterium]